jgi:hypothetical protein
MEPFRILTEERHKYKKDTLYVLAFRDGEGYGIDVTNSNCSFGKIKIKDKDKAEYLFSLLNDFIADHKDYLEACTYVSSILAYETYEEVVITIHTYRRKVEKMEAYVLIHMLGLEKQDQKMALGTHIIKISRKGSDERLGEFISIADTGKYMFHFF